MSTLIILCGQPYAGKTTLGRAIVEMLRCDTVDVDVTKERLYGLGLKDDDLTHEQWVTIYDDTDKQIAEYLPGGRSVLDDSAQTRHDIDDEVFEQFLALIEPPAEDECPLIFNCGDDLEAWIELLFAELA